MFYSHEILTSREGGVATVWLVATLGSKSNLKKVNRKAILDVDVPKTCEIIITPEAPMALRLQSNLLYGVSRVYFQQCGYVLSDAQTAQSNMRALLKVVRTAELDPDAGKARPDQLVVEDDPAFLPDFPGLDIDLSALDISTDGSSRQSSILSPHSLRSSLTSNADGDRSMLGLIIPTSDTGGAGDIGGFDLPGDDHASVRPSSRLRSLLEDEEEGFNLDPGFTIDTDGNVVLTGQDQPQAAVGVRVGSESAASARVRQEFEEGRQAVELDLAGAMNLDLDLPRLDDDGILLPEAEAFPEMMPQIPAGTGFLRSSSAVPNEEESSESAEAPQRRKPREPRELPVDMMQELRNADLAQWNNNYVTNMTSAGHSKSQHRAPALSKKNAAFWVIGAGIGGVGSGIGSSKLTSPLDMFAGDRLMQALTGTEARMAGKKRSRDEEDDHGSDSEERRVRVREGDGAQIGRGQGIILGDDDAMGMMGSEGIEVGRHAPPALEDQSSQFPWNMSASRAGSRQGSTARAHGFAGSVGGFPSSVGGPGSLPGTAVMPGSLDRRASRITSASPLTGRGLQRLGSLEFPQHDDDDDFLGGRTISSLADDFQLYGPAAGVSTQTAAESQWIQATLDRESSNFLDFVKDKVTAKLPILPEEEDELSGGSRPRPVVFFEELLPPAQHTKIVAAQAFHHVLALATRGLINVQQEQVIYGPIELGLATGV